MQCKVKFGYVSFQIDLMHCDPSRTKASKVFNVHMNV